MAGGRRAVATMTPTCQVLGLLVRSTRVGSSDQSSGRKLFVAVMQFRKVAWSPSGKHSVSVSTSLSGRGLPSHGEVLRSCHILAISRFYPGSVPIGLSATTCSCHRRMRGRRCRGGGAAAAGAARPPPRRRPPLCRLGHPSRGGRRGGRARGQRAHPTGGRRPSRRAPPPPPPPPSPRRPQACHRGQWPPQRPRHCPAAAASAVASDRRGGGRPAGAATAARGGAPSGRRRRRRRWLWPPPFPPTAWRLAGVGARLPLPPASGGRRPRRRGSPVNAARVRAWRRRPVAAAPAMAAAAASAPPPPRVAAAAGTRRPPRRPIRQGHPGRVHPAPPPAPRRRAWARGRCGSGAPPPPRTCGRAADGGPVGARRRGGRRRRAPRRRGGCEACIGRHARGNSWRRGGGGVYAPRGRPAGPRRPRAWSVRRRWRKGDCTGLPRWPPCGVGEKGEETRQGVSVGVARQWRRCRWPCV